MKFRIDRDPKETQKEHLQTTVEGSTTSHHPVAPKKEEQATKGHAKGKQVDDHFKQDVINSLGFQDRSTERTKKVR